MQLQAGDLVLCSGTLERGVPFAERLAAAQAGGFDGVSLWARDYQSAREEGHSDLDLNTMLDDYGLSVAEFDPAWWWLPGASEVHIPSEFDRDDIFRFKEAEFLAMAATLNARSVNAVDIFGGTWTTEEAAESFAHLCGRAAEFGLLVHLEFLPWSRIPDLATAWKIVQMADERNGGVAIDSWHYFRGAPNEKLLRSIPGDRIMNIQLSDAPVQAESNLIEATLHDRLLPGAGDLGLVSLIADLRAIGANAPIGVEVFSDALRLLPAADGARLSGEAVRQLLTFG